MWQQNAIFCPNDDDRGSTGGVHPSARPSRLHSRIGCHCGPFRWLWSPQTSFCILRQNALKQNDEWMRWWWYLHTIISVFSRKQLRYVRLYGTAMVSGVCRLWRSCTLLETVQLFGNIFAPYGSPIILGLPASNIITKFRRGHSLRGR